MQINKSDRNDATGIARIMQTGWYRQVQVKSLHSHAIRGLLNSRALLVKVQRDLENQLRGLLKSAGLIIGRAKDGVFSARTKELLATQTDLAAIALPLLEARAAIHHQLALLERRVRQLAKEHAQTSCSTLKQRFSGPGWPHELFSCSLRRGPLYRGFCLIRGECNSTAR
jgi:transposase